MLFDKRTKLEFKWVDNIYFLAVTQPHKDIVIAVFAETNLLTLRPDIYAVSALYKLEQTQRVTLAEALLSRLAKWRGHLIFFEYQVQEDLYSCF